MDTIGMTILAIRIMLMGITYGIRLAVIIFTNRTLRRVALAVFGILAVISVLSTM